MRKKPFNPQDERYAQRIEKRLEKTNLVEVFDEPENEDIVIMGSYSRTWRNEKKRQIKAGKCDIVADRSDSPISHARDYLQACYTRRPAKADTRKILKSKQMPVFVSPCIIREASYVDIKSAWWSIMLRVGWNCEYNPGRWLGYGDPPEDFPLVSNKVARSSLVTIARSSLMPVWKDGKMNFEWVYNNVENLHIWGVIADVLHVIARVAITLYECKYVATDGFILPTRNAPYLQGFIDSLGLETKIKWEGPAIVAGAGSYMHSGQKTLRSATFRPISNIDYSIDANWMLGHFTYCKRL